MALDIGAIRASLTLNTSNFTNQLKTVQGAMKNAFGPKTQQDIANTDKKIVDLTSHLKSVERIVGGIFISQGFYRLTNEIGNATSAMMGFMGQMEKAQIAMEYFLGDSERAAGFIYNMKDFAADTAFSTEQALTLSRRLMAGQFDPSKVRSMMEILNDASSASGGTAEQMDRIVLALTQMKTNGKIAGQELRQFAEAGIPIYQILREELGLTSDELMKIGDQGLSGDLGVQAVLSGLEKRYKGAAERIAQTVPAMWDSIKDNMLMVGEAVFAYPYRVMAGGLKKVRDALTEAREVITTSGFGGLFERMFDKGTQADLRTIAAALRSLGGAMVHIAQTTAPLVRQAFSSLASGVAVLLPMFTMLVRLFALIYRAAIQVSPGVLYLVGAIAALGVASAATKVMLLLWRVTGIGMIASTVAGAVMRLAGAIRILSIAMITNPLVALGVAAGVAFLWWASTTDVVRNSMAKLIQMIQKLAGMDGADLFKPVKSTVADDMAEFNESAVAADENLKKIADASKKAGEAAKKAAKKVKDSFVASFDELFQIPDKNKDVEDSLDDIGEIPDFKIPDMPGGDENPLKWPDKIKFPDIEWPKFEWPLLPPWLTKGFRWPKFEWPKFPKFPDFPNFPGALVTSWEWSMNALRGFLRGFEFDLSGLSVRIPNLIPQIFPQGVWDPILEGLGNFGNSLGQAWDGLTGQLRERWAQGWGSMGVPLATWAADALAGIGNFGSAAIPALAGIGAGLVAGLGAAWTTSTTAVSTWAAGVLETITSTGASWGSSLATTGASIVATLGSAWTTASQAVTTWGAGVLASMTLAGSQWIASMGPTLATIGTLFTEFTKSAGLVMSGLWAGIKIGWGEFSKTFSNLVSNALKGISNFWSEHKKTILITVGLIIAGILLWWVGLPAGIGAALMAMIRLIGPYFGRLLPMFTTAVKNIPSFFKTLMGKLPKEAQTAISSLMSYFKALPGRIWEALKGIPKLISDAFKGIELPSLSGMVSSVSASLGPVGKIAGFAGGGIIGKDSIVRVGERGRREAIVPLQNPTAMQPFVDAIVAGMGGVNNNPQPASDGRPTMYVHTLIADDRSLKELDRRMKVVRQSETQRGG